MWHTFRKSKPSSPYSLKDQQLITENHTLMCTSPGMTSPLRLLLLYIFHRRFYLSRSVIKMEAFWAAGRENTAVDFWGESLEIYGIARINSSWNIGQLPPFDALITTAGQSFLIAIFPSMPLQKQEQVQKYNLFLKCSFGHWLLLQLPGLPGVA